MNKDRKGGVHPPTTTNPSPIKVDAANADKIRGETKIIWQIFVRNYDFFVRNLMSEI